MVERMVEVTPVADEAEEQLSLDAYNETWPHARYALAEVQSFKASLLDYADLLARSDGEVLGSGFAAIHPGFPQRVFTLITVPERNRRRGAGTALYQKQEQARVACDGNGFWYCGSGNACPLVSKP